jgi:O-antigen/teichoic acid export membrane protein
VIGRLQPLWAGEGRGTLWLGLGVGSTFALGLLLQVLALRALSDGDYATFVLALGIGNIANAIAVTVQPMIAASVAKGEPVALPAQPWLLAGAAGGVVFGGAMLLGGTVGWVVAVLAMLQIPLHAAVGAGLGGLQGSRRFGALASALLLWTLARVLVAVAVFVTLDAPALGFVLALPAALALELLLLLRVGALRGAALTQPRIDLAALRPYAVWALLAWLLNADAVYGHARLPAVEADAYAVALTLGRQTIYLAVPLATVLLPVTLAGARDGQRGRLYAILLVTALLLVAGGIVLGVRPELIVRVLSGGTKDVGVGLVRGYVVVGALAAGATLLLTFLFGLVRLPRLRWWGLLAVASASAAMLWASTAEELLLVQLVAVGALFAALASAGFAATAVERVERQAPASSTTAEPTLGGAAISDRALAVAASEVPAQRTRPDSTTQQA